MAGEREGEGGRSCYFHIITVEAKEEDEVARLTADPLAKRVRMRSHLVPVLYAAQMGGLHVVHVARLIPVGRCPCHAPVLGILLQRPSREVDHREGRDRFLLAYPDDARLQDVEILRQVAQLLEPGLDAIENAGLEGSLNLRGAHAVFQEGAETMEGLFRCRLHGVLDHALDDADARVVEATFESQHAQLEDDIVTHLLFCNVEQVGRSWVGPVKIWDRLRRDCTCASVGPALPQVLPQVCKRLVALVAQPRLQRVVCLQRHAQRRRLLVLRLLW